MDIVLTRKTSPALEDLEVGDFFSFMCDVADLRLESDEPPVYMLILSSQGREILEISNCQSYVIDEGLDSKSVVKYDAKLILSS